MIVIKIIKKDLKLDREGAGEGSESASGVHDRTSPGSESAYGGRESLVQAEKICTCEAARVLTALQGPRECL